ncbi:MAG: SMC-Scp complex subunit ScpB [Candidatus Aceula meridiana]|nr:SMC-Scp complex subunit ScpB [Candidatus Aceula meridiana]
MDNDLQYIKGVAEALLFVSEKPVTMDEFKNALEGVDTKALRQAIEEMKENYQERQSGMVITEIAGGYQMLSNPQYAASVRVFYRTQKKERLSKPSLETLAIIAYKQPVTRIEVEMIRGVNSDGVVNHLLEKGLLKINGRKDVPGKPYIYGTTKQFLEYFGLRSLADLPRLEEFETLEDGPQKIQAFQQVTEKFIEQAEENAPEDAFVGAEETPSVEQVLTSELPDEAEPTEQDAEKAEEPQDIEKTEEPIEKKQENQTISQKAKPQEAASLLEQETVTEGGSNEHPQAS